MSEHPPAPASPGGTVHLRNDRVELSFDGASGRWLALRDLARGASVMEGGGPIPPVLLTVDGRTEGSRGIHQNFGVVDARTVGLDWALEGIERCRTGDLEELVVRLREGDWRVELRHGLRPGSARVERRLRLSYAGDGESLLRSFVLRTPLAALGRPVDTFVEAPGYPVRPRRRVSMLPYGPWGQLVQGPFADAPAWRPPLVGLHNPDAGVALAAWAHTETEPFYPMVDRADGGVMLGQRVFLADRFGRGHSLEWGTQYVELYHDTWLGALARFQRFYDEVGMAAPEDVPEWARAVDMYEVHVGTLTGTTLAPYPTYEPLIADLPRIREKGFDVVYIMPHVPYPSYSVIDYLDMGIHQGDDAGFRRFIGAAHELGLKVFIDVTLHGVMDRQARRLLGELEGRSPEAYPVEPSMPERHPYLVEHPEWFSRTERGDVAMTYTYSFDHANPSWQDFMARVFRYYVEEYDVDGFRVDSHTWNFFPNWARDLPYPASRSFYGSAQLFKRVRAELKRIKPEVVLYTETAGPLIHTSHELGYNYDETWMLLSTLPVLSRRGMLCHFLHPLHVTTERMTARDIAHWMTQRRLVMQPGAIKVRALDNHDTYWRPKEFRRETFGVPAARAIVGLFAFVDGGFMDYNGADEGSEEFYGRVMRLRRTQPTLKRGSCDYLAVEPSDEMVFAPLRALDGHYLLPVINLDNRSTSVGLPLPVEAMALDAPAYAVRDLMGGAAVPGPRGPTWAREELTGLRVDLDAHGVMLLDFVPARA